MKLYHDHRATTPQQIVTFFHCARCLDEMPADMSPREFARTQTGLCADGSIQVVCNRHGLNVTRISPAPPADLDYDEGARIRPGEDCDCCNRRDTP